MKIKIFPILIIFLVFACDQKESAESLMKEIESIYDLPEGLTAENAKKLIELKEHYISSFDDSMSVVFLNELGFYYYQSGDYEKAEDYLKSFVEKTKNSEIQGHAYLTLAKNYVKKDNFEDALISVQKALNTEYSPIGGGLTDITNIVESKISAEGADVNDYLILFNTAKSAQQPQMALAMADSIHMNFRDYEKQAELLFAAANVAWDLLENEQVAKKYFETIINEFPNHDLAKESKYILENNYTSMTPEEILEDILKKNKES
jgi:TolA-binding protein